MSQVTITESALFKAISDPTPATTLAPGPTLSSSGSKAALRRCCAAWRRAYKAYMDAGTGRNTDSIYAARNAAEAFCNAMPLLSGEQGIRDFIACAAHGVLIGAIDANKSGQLLYAAQVALGTLNRGSKPRKTAA